MTKNGSGYYDFNIDFEEALFENGMVDDMFYVQDLQQRKLFLNTEIDQYYVWGIAKHILQYNCDDKDIDVKDRKPILLYITSNGGDVDSGFELIDIILSSKTPVYTINLGYQYSMGFLIGLAGHKRYATINAKFLHHDGTNAIFNSGTKVRDQMKFQNKVEERIKQYVIDRTKVTEDEYDSHLRQEWYLFADEAKKYGMTDYIIGIDCNMDDVI